MVYPVGSPAADADDPPLPDGDIHGVAVRVQDRGRRNPTLHLIRGDTVGEEGVDPSRPGLSGCVGRAAPPRLRDPIALDHGNAAFRQPVLAGPYPRMRP